MGYSVQHKAIDGFFGSITANCDQRKPVFAGGISETGDGHAWVISGYRVKDVRHDYEVWTFMRYNSFSIYENLFSDSNMSYEFYINWGWDGGGNGYYYIPLDYTNHRAYLYNITPNR